MIEEDDEVNNEPRQSLIEEMNDPVSPISGVAPPREGRWKPGQSGNPGGRPKWKPMTEALQRLAEQEPRLWDELVRSAVVKGGKGDMTAINSIWDRIEGKIAQTVGGSTEMGPMKLVIEWEK